MRSVECVPFVDFFGERFNGCLGFLCRYASFDKGAVNFKFPWFKSASLMRTASVCHVAQLAQAAEHFGIAQSRVSDLVRGKWDKFSLDMLITLAARAGHKVELAMA